MEKITFTPREVRGAGDVLDSRSRTGFINKDSNLTMFTEVVNNISCTVFQMTPYDEDEEYYFNLFKQALISKGITHLINGMSYSDGVVAYTMVNVNSISYSVDINGVIFDLNYSDGVISYSSFDSSNATYEDYMDLETALTDLEYNNGVISYDMVGDLT